MGLLGNCCNCGRVEHKGLSRGDDTGQGGSVIWDMTGWTTKWSLERLQPAGSDIGFHYVGMGCHNVTGTVHPRVTRGDSVQSLGILISSEDLGHYTREPHVSNSNQGREYAPSVTSGWSATIGVTSACYRKALTHMSDRVPRHDVFGFEAFNVIKSKRGVVVGVLDGSLDMRWDIERNVE